ncbi:MAG: phosphatidate cytidylyltransferase [Bacillota bacterium]
MLRTRVVTAVVFGLVLLGALYLGGPIWALLVSLVAAAICAEYLGLWRSAGVTVAPALAAAGYLVAVVWPVAAWVQAGTAWAQAGTAGPGGAFTGLLLTLIVLVSLAVLVLTYPASSAGGGLLVLAGSIYVGWTLAHLILLRLSGPHGLWRAVLVFAGVWATDSMAYFIGTLLGRHKLKPSLSPHKSVEGAVGGLLGGVLAAWLVGIPLGLPAGLRLGLGLAVAVVGQVGDLAESALKRYAGMKDSGNALPGHGGLLDRFDSTLLSAPLVYYVLALWASKGGVW